MEKAIFANKIYESYLKAKEYFPDEIISSELRNPDLLADKFQSVDGEKCIVVTGSKGKGSISRMIAAAIKNGLSLDCGLFLSPHIFEFNERISISGEDISDEDLCRYLRNAYNESKKSKVNYKKGEYVSPIGILALSAVNYFIDKCVDYYVFECGKGAKFDDVNRIPHKYAVIGTIFLEHVPELGKTIEEIAFDKAHVITDETKWVYSMPQTPKVLNIIKERARKMGAKLLVCGEDFPIKDFEMVLRGEYQKAHASIALEVVKLLVQESLQDKNQAAKQTAEQAKEQTVKQAKDQEKGQSLESKAVEFDYRAAQEAVKSVRIPGRMEVVSEDPFVFMDCAINRESAKEIVVYLKENEIRDASLIMCLPDDKDFVGVAMLLTPYFNRIILSKIDHPHYPMKADQRRILQENNVEAVEENDFHKAFLKAQEGKKPVVIVCANTFVNKIKDYLHNKK